MAAVAIEHRQTIIERIAAGYTRNQVAQALGITGAAISQQLANDPEYQQAREHGTEQRLDQAEDELRGADDALTLARARDWWKAVSWRAEREHAHRWGQRPLVAVQVNTAVSDADLIALLHTTGVMSNSGAAQHDGADPASGD